MNPEGLVQIAERLKTADRIAILPHSGVDGDALGASLALAIGLTSIGKSVDVLLEEQVPRSLDFLPGCGLIRSAAAPSYDVALNVDNGDLTRLGAREPVYRQAASRLSIDHHATNRVVADISHVDTGASATGEIVFDLLAIMEIPLDPDIALCLYTAILTDTGGFRFTNTTPRTHQIAAVLMAFGIDCNNAAKRVFDTIPMSKMLLMKQVMNHMQVCEDGLLAISFLRLEDILEAGGESDDFEGMVNIGRNLEGVEVSFFIREDQPGKLKGSLRSNACVDVAEIAETIGGGGHVRAAGFSTEGSLDEVIGLMRERILSAIRNCRTKGGL
jgi:bifunctional oligoribonuclease and PAP phosphatase NrnA